MNFEFFLYISNATSNPTLRYQALLFDLDGTLVDSIDQWSKAYLATLRDWDVEMTEQEFMDRIYSHSMYLESVLKDYGHEQQEVAFRAERDARYVAALREHVAWLPQAQDVLEQCTKLAPVGLVTGSWQKYVDAIDEKLDLLRYFQTTVVCDETLTRSKPDPYPLTLAAEKLGVDPQQCLYIGDQLFDVEAAEAAAMPYCLIRGRHTPEIAVERAAVVLDHIEEVLHTV